MKTYKTPFFLVLTVLCINSACAQNQTKRAKVKTGIEVLAQNNFKELEGKRIGLITNATGINSKLKSTIDILYEAKNIELVALYGPEHGVRGEVSAGDKIADYTDEVTGLPVFSLYGSTRKPTSKMLEGIDVLMYDIQDIGVRSYTYISTMGLAMEAAAENDIEFVVLDRPNPLGGNRIEGNIVEEGYFSFVSQYPVPYVYGLTPGEIASMINEEGWLEDDKKAELTVIEMENWSRSMTFAQTGLPWVPTSPHIPHSDSPYYYVATGIMGELGVISEGVGYTLPFQLYGAEWIEEKAFAEEMNTLNISGVGFRPTVYKPYYGKDKGKTLRGVQIHFTDYSQVHLMSLQFYAMEVLKNMYPERDILEEGKNRWTMFDKVLGSNQIRIRFKKSYKVSDVLDYFNKDVDSFRVKSQKYHLYK